MARRLRIRLDELKTDLGQISGFELQVGRIVEEWEEPEGPTPMPSVHQLRDWDHILLKRYKPVYLPFCDLCCLCTYGKCDLSRDKRGVCGLDMAGQQSRIVLLACCIGAATHTAHARELVDELIKKYGRDHPIDLGSEVFLEAPHMRLVCGIKPRTLGDLEDALDYLEMEICKMLASTHTGQEGDNIDFESKVLHVGMLDHVGMEIADIAQIVALGFPKADPEAPLVDIGMGVVDQSKPVILVIGHNVLPSTSIIDYLEESGLYDAVEVCGLCCSAHDITRYTRRAKIIGPMSWEIRFIRTGVPDVIVLDEQCVKTDIPLEARKIGAVVIATSEKAMHGFPDLTDEEPDKVVEKLVNGEIPGVYIHDPERVGEIAVKAALKVAPKRARFKALPSVEEVVSQAKRCRECYQCVRACPHNLPITEAMRAAKKGDISKLADLYDYCLTCARCEKACPVDIPIVTLMLKASERKFREEKFKIRVGRGPIQDTEIRKVGQPIVMGEIPGVIAFVGCPNYSYGGRDVYEMCQEFLKRNYIVTVSGCAAMTIAMYKNAEGRTLYEEYPGVFDAGGLVNVGSCVANAHISGAAIKIASIFAKRRLRANYKEIADYIHTRVGACGIAWGAMSQKAAAIASGFWRLGIPVIVGPHGSKYRRMLMGRRENEEDWYVYDAFTGERVYAGPVPEHLFYTAETKEEAIVMAVKLCMRASDTTKGRQIKLTNYIDLHKKFFGTLPDDLHLFVRREADIPITMKEEVLEFLKKKGWKERREVPNPTLLKELVGKVR
ncbi:CO dehydrogenase/acetyl-CoA synthase complex subunit epsilon [Candidatus Geothermarchaeota archaeon ex4572_27]|nr:MAG: CO dehydrogenase/acetyl-CoA synthase complex subunit epsilon [Candidatus Geothermarchaeota archaeon ex4572_27]